LVLATPAPPAAILDGKDLSTLAPALLSSMAYRHAGAGAYPKAAQCQYWLVQATKQGRYDLACWEALAERTGTAMYWLQEAGRLEGIDVRWAQLDPDLATVREDSDWPKLLAFLRGCEKYWRAVSPKQTVLIVPDGYDGRKELTVVVWLHGMGGSPADFKTAFQALANKHQLGFVGVSGTIPTGKTKFSWADVVAEDYERIGLALAEARERIRWREGTAVVLGFSQGAMVGLEIAVRHPEAFAGAITISAGTGSPVQLDAVSDKRALARQGFVLVCGAKEHPASVERSKVLEVWLKTANAKVSKPSYPNHAAHGFPADFAERLPEWLAFVEQARASAAP
jgi:predicted esterase